MKGFQDNNDEILFSKNTDFLLFNASKKRIYAGGDSD